MTVLLAAVAAVVALLSARVHVRRATAARSRATSAYHAGLASVWLVVSVAYLWVAIIGGGVANAVGHSVIRPSIVLIGALHIALEGQYRRGEW